MWEEWDLTVLLHLKVFSHVRGSVKNNNGFWIGCLDLLTLSCKISLNYNQSSAEHFFLDHRGRSPFCISFYDDCKCSSLSPTTLEHRSPRKQIHCPGTDILFCWPGVFTAALRSNGRPTVVTRLRGKVCTGLLPSNRYASQYTVWSLIFTSVHYFPSPGTDWGKPSRTTHTTFNLKHHSVYEKYTTHLNMKTNYFQYSPLDGTSVHKPCEIYFRVVRNIWNLI
jgi:hypothetical protein